MKQRNLFSRWIDGINPYRLLTLFVLVFLCAGGMFTWMLLPERHEISVDGLGSPVSFWTTARDLNTALRSGGIQLGPKDQVSPPLNTPLKGQRGVSVHVTKALPVTVAADDKLIQSESVAATVGDLLKELSVQLNPKDTVSCDLTAAVTAGIQVRVVRHTEAVAVSQIEIPFDTVRREDRTMDQGETKEVQAGENGIKEVSQLTYLEDGTPVKTEVVKEQVVKDPVPRIIAYGTVGVVFRGGQSFRYVKELELSATGYTAGKESNPNGNGYTYTGMKAVHGVVAVDPSVIPLYTRLYIDGYGPAVAADIGGSIKGNRIDLCFDSLADALNWGRRTVKVYVLSD